MRYMLYVFLCLIVITDSALCREWADDTGKFHTEAEFIEIRDNHVILRRPNGKELACEWERLSASDQEFVELVVATHKSAQTANDAKTLRAANGRMPASVIVTQASTLCSTTNDRLGTDKQTQASHVSNKVLQAPAVGKRIFSGYHSTFQLYGTTGTGSYWFRGADGVRRHYLANLTYHDTTANGYLVYSSVGLEGGVYTWYFYDTQANQCGCYPGNAVWYAVATGGPRFYESSYRETPK